jgi:hypothetical protein
MAIIADDIDGVRRANDLRIGEAGSLIQQAPELKGILVGADGLIYVSNLERLISDADEIQLKAVTTDFANDCH